MIPKTNPKHVIVVGGGIIGATSAYYLSRAGWRVTMLELAAWGQGASHGNCGLVSRSHVFPLNEPGVVKRALGSLFDRNAPLRIKPRVDLALWRWLLRFAGNCNSKHMAYAAPVRQALLESSTNLYHALMRDEALQCEWRTAGCLFLFRTADGRAHFNDTIERLAPFGFTGDAIAGAELPGFEPSLKSDLHSGYFYPHDAHLHPGRLMDSMRTILERGGVRIIENTPVRRFDIQNGKAIAAITDGGAHAADAFVLAAGARSPALQRDLGCSLPIVPAKGYSTTMARPQICPTRPLYFHEKRVVATPMDSAYRLGSTLEFAGFDTSLHPHRIRMLREGAEGFMNDPHPDPVEEEWFGFRPMTSDGLPLIGLAPKASNLCIAAGHNMDGISMGPGTGKLVSEILGGTTPHIDPAPFRPNRA